MTIDNPVAVVTGANRGLGLELCRQLLQRDWRVVALCRRSSTDLDALAGDATSGSDAAAAGSLTVVQGVDVSNDGCVALVQQALAGVRVGLLILNAGVLSVDSVAELDTGVIRQQFEVNALGPLRIAHALLPNLVSAARPAPHDSGPSNVAGDSGAGPATPAGPAAKVVVVTSKMGSISLTRVGGKCGSAGYRMSKAAANMGAQLLALELAPRGIPVLAVHPGAVATDMHTQYWATVGAGGSAGAHGMAPSAQGPISVQAAAAGLLARLDELDMAGTGRFLQAATGEELPW